MYVLRPIYNINLHTDKLLPLIKEIFVGYEEDESIEKLIANRLISNNSTISFAESFTGGKISDSLVSVPGSSSFFKGSHLLPALRPIITIIRKGV